MTVEAKHTPGEWRVEQGTTLIWGDCNPDDQTNYGMGYPIAECRLTPSASWAKGPRKVEEAQANAAHIVRCVNSHDALVEALEALEVLVALNEDSGPFGGELYHDRVDRAWDRARAAIAKAIGDAHA